MLRTQKRHAWHALTDRSTEHLFQLNFCLIRTFPSMESCPLIAGRSNWANRTPNTKVLIKSSLRRTATPDLLRRCGEREILLALQENCRILPGLQRISVLQCVRHLLCFSGKWFEIKESKSKILKWIFFLVNRHKMEFVHWFVYRVHLCAHLGIMLRIT